MGDPRSAAETNNAAADEDVHVESAQTGHTQTGDIELDSLARRLHGGPLQCFFAGVMMLEGAALDGGDRATVDGEVVDVLRQGARELNEIIDALHTATSAT